MNNENLSEEMVTEEKRVSKFEAMLGESGDKLLKKRATMYAKSVESHMKTKKLELEEKINSLDMAISRHEDLGVDTTESLRPAEFDAAEWVSKLNQLSMDKRDVKEALEIVTNNYNKYFK